MGTPSEPQRLVREDGSERSGEAKPRPEDYEPRMRLRDAGEGTACPEAQHHRQQRAVDAAGAWGEGRASYPGRSGEQRQKSAEAVVAREERGEGPNVSNHPAARSSRGEGDPAKWTETSTPARESRSVAPGIPRGEGQAPAAPREHGGVETAALMERVVSRENMTAAHTRVVANAGAPGVDGLTVDALMSWCRVHWDDTRRALLSGTYRPNAVRRVEIPKPDGKGVRMLGIPTVVDRLIQQAILQVLQPLFDPTFSDGSFGFRPGRSTHHAVLRARAHIAEGATWVVDIDLEKFFDRVNHDVLMARLARRVEDKRLLRVLRAFLEAGMMQDGVVSPRQEGTPQGGPLSPLLSNVLLDDLDKELERRGHRFVRYADDCNVYVQSEAAGGRVMASLEKFLADRLRLRINREKSAVARPWDRKFLGFTVTIRAPLRLKVASQSVIRLRAKLRPIWRHGRGRALSDTINALAPILRGWIAYYRLSEVKTEFDKLDGWIRRHLRALAWRHWKSGKTRRRKFEELGLRPARAMVEANKGGGPWPSAAGFGMQAALSNALLKKWGLVSLLAEWTRFACR